MRVYGCYCFGMNPLQWSHFLFCEFNCLLICCFSASLCSIRICATIYSIGAYFPLCILKSRILACDVAALVVFGSLRLLVDRRTLLLTNLLSQFIFIGSSLRTFCHALASLMWSVHQIIHNSANGMHPIVDCVMCTWIGVTTDDGKWEDLII